MTTFVRAVEEAEAWSWVVVVVPVWTPAGRLRTLETRLHVFCHAGAFRESSRSIHGDATEYLSIHHQSATPRWSLPLLVCMTSVCNTGVYGQLKIGCESSHV